MIHTPAPNRPPLAAIAVFVACSLAFVGARLTLHAQEQLDFIASFTDANGSPVTDAVGRAHDARRWREGYVVYLQPVERAMDVTLLIDNGLGMGAAMAQVRTGAKGFFAALPEGSQLSLLTLAPQPRWLLRPTNSREGALRAVDRIVPDESRARFLDALIEAGERMGKQSEGRAPVIVAIGSNAPDGSTALEQHFNKLARQLVEYSATVHTAVFASGVKAASVRMPGGISSDLQQTIGFELAKLTGGRDEQIAASSRLETLLPEIGNRIKGESRPYRLKVRRPDGAKGPVGPVAFGIARQGVTVGAMYDNTVRK